MKNAKGQKNAGYEIIHERLKTLHPDDVHLRIVLGRSGTAVRPEKYVTWLYNAKDGGFAAGYYHDTLSAAYEDYERR